MPDRLCSIEGCDTKHQARGWCNLHYHRWCKWGDPLKTYYRNTCTLDGCDEAHLARGWCRLHYQRWESNGDPEMVQVIRDDDERRLWSKIDASGDCWEWTGGASRQGYGKFKINGQTLGAHRVVWEQLVGPIGDDMTLDHLCRNTLCVNPDHLEEVDIKTNVMRGYGAIAQRMRNEMRANYPW